jgi:dienelactone hydrolase
LSAAKALAAAIAIALLRVPPACAEPPPSPGALMPRAPATLRTLERHWSRGALWSLLPTSEAPPHLSLREGENYQVRAIEAAGSGVLVVWLPHAAGTETGSELVARLATRRGWGVVSLLPPAELPPPGASAGDWVSLVEERVREGRAALHARAAGARPCIALMGVSVGGIAALRVAELEREVDVVAAMLAGAGARGFLHAARTYGASPDAPSPRTLERVAVLDPAGHAAQLAGRKVLLVRARLDEAIPRDSFEALRSALGAPEVHGYPIGHESFGYAMPFAIERALGWVERACAERSREAARLSRVIGCPRCPSR